MVAELCNNVKRFVQTCFLHSKQYMLTAHMKYVKVTNDVEEEINADF